MRPDGIIFDFDGVVVDTEPIHHRAFQVVLEPLGLGFSWEAYQEGFMGFDDRDAFREAFRRSERPLTDQMLHELIAAKAKSFDEIIESGV
ncbi:MAG: HAD hydrolase-like protein, partial [Trichlorobacter sp.]